MEQPWLMYIVIHIEHFFRNKLHPFQIYSMGPCPTHQEIGGRLTEHDLWCIDLCETCMAFSRTVQKKIRALLTASFLVLCIQVDAFPVVGSVPVALCLLFRLNTIFYAQDFCMAPSWPPKVASNMMGAMNPSVFSWGSQMLFWLAALLI